MNDDLDFLFKLENDTSIWSVSNTKKAYTKKQISNYIKNSSQDISIAKQFRLVIDLKGKQIGCIDLYDYEMEQKKAGIGIVITKENRNKGFAKQALLLLIDYAWNYLNMKELYAYILPDNKASLNLFLNTGFVKQENTKFILKK